MHTPPPPPASFDPVIPPQPAPPGPYVSAGTELTVVLSDDVGTESSAEGESFGAVLAKDLFSPDGTLLVPRGAFVEGKVVRVESGRSPLLALDFTAIETPAGPADVVAMLHDAERVALPNRDEVYDPVDSPYDAFFSAWYLPGPLGQAAPPESTSYGDFYDVHDGTIEVPAGTRLRLELTRHLILPGASAERP